MNLDIKMKIQDTKENMRTFKRSQREPKNKWSMVEVQLENMSL